VISNTLGRKLIHLTGYVLLVISNASIVVGSYYIKDDRFFYLCLITQTFGGIGTAIIQNTNQAILNVMYMNESSQTMTTMQVGIGIGLMLGPLMSTFFVKIGGFALSFIVTAGLLALMFIIGLFLIPAQ
jgi:MFS family permease